MKKETSFGNDFYIYLVGNDLLTFSEAISHDASLWKEAIKLEIESIKKCNTWVLVYLPLGSKCMGCKWIFKRIYNLDRTIEKYNAKLVAKGYT